MSQVLEVSNLTKHFGSKQNPFVAVDNISFHMESGEILGLLGPNGAGKTTTIMMMLGMVTPTCGNIKIFGLELNSHRSEILQKMNYTSAFAKMPGRLSVEENLKVFAHLYNIDNPNLRISQLLQEFDLVDHKKTLVEDLSSGNKARVNLCKAFINQPKLLLLDEPTSSLDPEIADRVRTFITSARDRINTSILITSHNMAEVEELCDRVIFINKGTIVAIDTPQSLAKRSVVAYLRLMMVDGQKRTIAYCEKNNLPVNVKKRFVSITLPETRIAFVLSDLAKEGVEYNEISIEKPTLEDFFIKEVRHATKT